jgi:hypothetical protein
MTAVESALRDDGRYRGYLAFISISSPKLKNIHSPDRIVPR